MLLWPCFWRSCWTKIYRTAFWMLNYGHPNDKRTKLWSTSYYVALFSQGKKDLTKKDNNAPPTTERYVDGAGRVRYKGTKALKSSQILVGFRLCLPFCWRCFVWGSNWIVIIYGLCFKMPHHEFQGLSAKLLRIHAPLPQNLVEVEASPAKGSRPAWMRWVRVGQGQCRQNKPTEND